MSCVFENKRSLIGFITKSGSVVIEYIPSQNRKDRWLVRCVDCTGEYKATGANLRKNNSQICKSCMKSNNSRENKNLIGKKFGKWNVIRISEEKSTNRKYLCVCDCENKTTRNVRGRDLISGRSKSCGCYKIEILRKENTEPKRRCDEYSKIRTKLTSYIFNRDNYKCVICCSNKKLNAHHMNGWKWRSEERFEEVNLITLCSECHKGFHRKFGKNLNTKNQFMIYLDSLKIDYENIILYNEEYKILNNFRNNFYKNHQYFIEY
jgi:hypothetical protein